MRYAVSALRPNIATILLRLVEVPRAPATNARPLLSPRLTVSSHGAHFPLTGNSVLFVVRCRALALATALPPDAVYLCMYLYCCIVLPQGGLKSGMMSILNGEADAGKELFELPVMIKADVQGSEQALSTALRYIPAELCGTGS